MFRACSVTLRLPASPKSAAEQHRTHKLRGARFEKLAKNYVQNVKQLICKSPEQQKDGAAINYGRLPPRSEK
jgi:hypothetical protein